MSSTTAPPGRYLIIGGRRSGTTVVHLLLKGHPAVSALNDELTLDPLFTRGLRAYTVGEHFTAAERAHGRLRLFDAVAGADAGPKTRRIGAKTVFGDVAAARMLVDAIQADLPGVRIVLVVRSDLVAQFGSQIQLRRSGIAHSWSPGARDRVAGKAKIDLLLFERYAINMLRSHRELRRLADSHALIEVSYERFAADNDTVYRELLDFLELPYIEPEWLHSKKVMPNPDEYISNYARATALQRRLEQAVSDNRISPGRELMLKTYKRVRESVRRHAVKS